MYSLIALLWIIPNLWKPRKRRTCYSSSNILAPSIAYPSFVRPFDNCWHTLPFAFELLHELD